MILNDIQILLLQDVLCPPAGDIFLSQYPLKSSVYLQREVGGVDFPGKKQRKVTPPNKISKA
jgi:hypothetical protein